MESMTHSERQSSWCRETLQTGLFRLAVTLADKWRKPTQKSGVDGGVGTVAMLRVVVW